MSLFRGTLSEFIIICARGKTEMIGYQVAEKVLGYVYSLRYNT